MYDLLDMQHCALQSLATAPEAPVFQMTIRSWVKYVSIRHLLIPGLLSFCAHPVFALDQGSGLPVDQTAVSVPGSEVFLKYCAGCHGFDGFAEYEHAPSFSMGERLHKSDPELLRSVVDGRHAMPYWENKLTDEMALAAIAYLRVMEQRHRSGLPPREEPLPDMHYKFKPVGEDDDYWLRREQAE